MYCTREFITHHVTTIISHDHVALYQRGTALEGGYPFGVRYTFIDMFNMGYYPPTIE